MENVITHKEIKRLNLYKIGGKAENLLKLEKQGFLVPQWLVISETRLLSFLSKHQDINTEAVSKAKLPTQLIQEIINFFPNTEYFAVRSSASDEDGSLQSFAGQYKSFLYVNKEQLEKKIKAVWLSIFSDRVKVYRQKNNLAEQFGISIIVQKMVAAKVSGVAFGLNPLNGNRREKVINSVFGLGEGLVSGELIADSYIVSEKEVKINLANKKYKFIQSIKNKSGIEKVKNNEEISNKSSLNDDQLKEIAIVLQTLFEKEGRYQDIEFAYKNDKLYILQTRPVTGIVNLADTSSKYIVWDNSNIIESYPGITLPLTYSYIIKLYEKAYRQFMGLLGVSEKEIEKNADYFANMLGLLNGRVYYNLRSWYKMISILPGYSLNAGFMEKMMGVKESFELDDFEKKSKLKSYLRLVYMLANIIKNLFSLEKEKEKFINFFNSFVSLYDNINPDKLSADELMDLYSHIESIMLTKWKAPLINDFFAMIYFGLLNKIIVKYFGKETNIHNDLLSGANDIVSTKPVYLIKSMVNSINGNPILLEIFKNENSDFIWRKVQFNELAEVGLQIMDYINEFGDRYVGELKLETQTYTQNPTQFVDLLKTYIQSGSKFSGNGEIEQEIRQSADIEISKTLKGKPLKKIILNHIIRKTRILVSGRENLRLFRTKAFGKTRIIFRAIAKKFYAEDLIHQVDDIFYLTKEEIFDFIKGTSVNYNLKGLIEYRKNKYEQFKKEPLQNERIKSYGIVYCGNDFIFNDNSKKIDDEDFKGIACCKGIVKAFVRIVKDPKEISNLNGDILVTSSTDPGWVTLFPSVSGILVERGSLLSHSAIVSREMGIPCIVGISNLLKKVKTGDLVEMDGSTGKIRIIVNEQKTKNI